MGIFNYTAEDTMGRTEDMNDVNYNESAAVPPSSNGLYRDSNNVDPGYVSSGRTAGGNRRTSRQGIRDFRRVRNIDNIVNVASLSSSGTTDMFGGGTSDTNNHSGLEGYGRYLGAPENTACYDSVFNDMETSEYSGNNMDRYNDTLDGECSLSVCNFNGGLESYARYLGSSVEPETYEGTSRVTGNFSLSHGTSAGGRFAFSNSSSSDFAGLGSYGQPHFENEKIEFSRGESRDLSYSDHYGYGDNY